MFEQVARECDVDVIVTFQQKLLTEAEVHWNRGDIYMYIVLQDEINTLETVLIEALGGQQFDGEVVH